MPDQGQLMNKVWQVPLSSALDLLTYSDIINMHFQRKGSMKYKRNRRSTRSGDMQGIYAYKTARCLLTTVGDWDFNIFNLDKLTNGRALFHIGLHLFQEYNLIDTFHLDIVKLMRCFTLIEEGYHGNNPYHNVVHAADVTQAMHCYLQEKKLAQCMTPLEVMIALLSAATHDLDHPGVNQGFLIATSNPLATLYKNLSVLENHHWRSAVGVLHESGVFDHLDPATWQKIEWQLKSLILATDITRQQEFVNKIKQQVDLHTFDLSNFENRHFITQIALKCADICNPCRTWHISKRWSEQVCDEFFQQGDYERQLHLPVTPNCDRYQNSVCKIQAGFMQHVVLPLFTEWHHFNPSQLSIRMLANIRANKASWDTIVAEMEMQREVEQGTESSEEENQDPSLPERVTTIVVHENASETRLEGVLLDEAHVNACTPRRHSLPQPALHKDLAIQFPRRSSLPGSHVQELRSDKRRNSLPKSLRMAHGTSLDRLSKLSSLAESINTQVEDENSGLETVTESRPKITSLGGTMRLQSSVSSHSMQHVDVRNRNAHSRASLPLLHLPPVWRGSWGKEAELTAQSFHYRNSLTNSGLMQSNTSRTNGNGSRQVLRPLTTNRRVEGHPTRGRSSSEEATTIAQRTHSLRGGIIYDRPRSLSLDIESQPLLRARVDRKSFSGESGVESEDLYAAGTFIYHEGSDLPTSPLMEEDPSSLTMPLLPEGTSLPQANLQ